MKIYNIEKMAATRTLYTATEKNSKGEQIAFELCECFPNNLYKNSLPNLWHKNGFTPNVLSSYICVTTYATNAQGECWGFYNPQATENNKIRFSWMLEVTEENKAKLIEEIERLAFAE